jgi:hypothetical protein
VAVSIGLVGQSASPARSLTGHPPAPTVGRATTAAAHRPARVERSLDASLVRALRLFEQRPIIGRGMPRVRRVPLPIERGATCYAAAGPCSITPSCVQELAAGATVGQASPIVLPARRRAVTITITTTPGCSKKLRPARANDLVSARVASTATAVVSASGGSVVVTR